MQTGQAVPRACRKRAERALDTGRVDGLPRELPGPRATNSREEDARQDGANSQRRPLTTTGNSVQPPSGLARGWVLLQVHLGTNQTPSFHRIDLAVRFILPGEGNRGRMKKAPCVRQVAKMLCVTP